MDGLGKCVYIGAGHLAKTKQAPYLIRELKKIMPKIDISIYSGGGNDILLKDLKFNNIDIDIESLLQERGPFPEVKISLTYDGDFKWTDQKFLIPIDTLKFEKRKLLNPDQIADLREEYKIRKKEKVVVVGSVHDEEYENILPSLITFLKNDQDRKVVFVPRNQIDRRALKRYSLFYETDSEKITGKENFLVIEKKGALDKLYSIADIVLLGNTFNWPTEICDGQNPLEPAFYGKRMLSGSRYEDWNKIAYDGLLKSGLLKYVSNSSELEKEIMSEWPEIKLREAQERAAEFIASQQGASTVFAKIIQKHIYNLLNDADREFISNSHSFYDLKARFN